jgi:hypothetical protein
MVLLINVLVFSMKIHLFEIRIAILRAYDAEYPPYREKYRLVLCDRLVLCWSSFRFSDQRDQQVLSLSIAKLEMQKKAIFCEKFDFSKPLYCEPVFSSHIGQYQRIHTEARKFIGIL